MNYEEHVAETVRRFGRHSDVGCPPGTRAMCSYRMDAGLDPVAHWYCLYALWYSGKNEDPMLYWLHLALQRVRPKLEDPSVCTPSSMSRVGAA